MRNPLIGVAVVALVVAVYFVFGQWFSPSPPAGPKKEPATVSYADQKTWLDRLKSKARVQFVQPVDPSVPLVSKDPETSRVTELTSLGPVEGQDLVLAEGFVASLQQLRSDRLLKLQGNMSTTSLRDAHEEARAAIDVELAIAMQKSLATGDYVTLPPGQNLPSGDNFEVTSIGIQMNGEPANIWFSFGVSTHPNIAQLRNYAKAVENAWLSDLVGAFNAQPLDQRQEHISRHWDRQLVSRAKWTPADYEHERTWFPAGIHADRASSLLVRNESQ